MASTTKISANNASSKSKIKSVTVFKSAKAEIVRLVPLDLKSGHNKFIITGLPTSIDTQSVRVSGLAPARLFDVVCTIERNKAAVYAPESSSEIVRQLKVRKAALEREKTVRDLEAELLVTYAKTLKGEHVTPAAMAAFLQSFVEQGRKNSEATAVMSEKIIEIDRQIEKELETSALKKGTLDGQVTVVIGSDSAAHVDLQLTYIVNKATSWEPTYELHAKTENGKPASTVSLHYRAHITQSTGEDWKDSKVTLSTVTSDAFDKGIPKLRPVKLRSGQNAAFQQVPRIQQVPRVHYQQPMQQQQLMQQQQPMQQRQLMQQQQPQAQTLGQFLQAPTGASNIHWNTPESWTVGNNDGSNSTDEEAFEDIPLPGANPGSSPDPTTVVTETPLAISYSVEGQSTIASDGLSHQVSIAVLPFEASISHVAVPRIEPKVYLQCRVKNTSEYRLLPGPVSVILDDSYVSKTSIQDINTGDTFTCTLGDDAATKIIYPRTVKTTKSNGGAFSEVFNTSTHTTKITIHNKHQFAISDLTVRDVIPMCDDKRIKVLLRKPMGLADAKDQVIDLNESGLKVMWEKQFEGGTGGEKEGRFEWKWKVDPGAKVTLESEWDVKAPADIQLSYTH